LVSFDGLPHAMASLTGPLWFTPGRGRVQDIRMGRFHDRKFESAPLQIVPVTFPNASERASGAVFETGSGRYARLQRVVYTGVFINEITRIDLAKSSFGADFYLWERFAHDAGPGAVDPADIVFDGMVSGTFDRAHPAELVIMGDGTEYRLWRVQGEFHNDFDLHRFPFDSQTLALAFFNARAAQDRVVYVLDLRGAAVAKPTRAAPAGGAMAAPALSGEPVASIASPEAFRNLTQWDKLSATERRDNLVTPSALGDPNRVGAESYRELSGFLVTVDLRRRALATLSKSLTPLFLMTVIMFASLYFPVALVKEKITVGITGALSGAVLLAAINGQLGGIGYTIALEYAFYLFFGLSLLCVVAVLLAERFRDAKRIGTATATERRARVLFLLVVAMTVVAGVGLAYAGG
jgi:hypothetical protein